MDFRVDISAILENLKQTLKLLLSTNQGRWLLKFLFADWLVQIVNPVVTSCGIIAVAVIFTWAFNDCQYHVSEVMINRHG